LRDAADAAALLQAARDSEGTVLDDRGRTLINAAIDHLCRNPQGTFRAVYFLTYTDKELSGARTSWRPTRA
jgi:hypothetical protein